MSGRMIPALLIMTQHSVDCINDLASICLGIDPLPYTQFYTRVSQLDDQDIDRPIFQETWDHSDAFINGGIHQRQVTDPQ